MTQKPPLSNDNKVAPAQDEKSLAAEFMDFCYEYPQFVGMIALPPLVATVWHDPSVFLATTFGSYLYGVSEPKRHEERLQYIDQLPLKLPTEEKLPENSGVVLASGTRLDVASPADRVINWFERHPDFTAVTGGVAIGALFGQPGIGLVVGSLALQAYKLTPWGSKHSVQAQADYHYNQAADELSHVNKRPKLADWRTRRAEIQLERHAKVKKYSIPAFYPY
jgi:hypothetical protein